MITDDQAFRELFKATRKKKKVKRLPTKMRRELLIKICSRIKESGFTEIPTLSEVSRMYGSYGRGKAFVYKMANSGLVKILNTKPRKVIPTAYFFYTKRGEEFSLEEFLPEREEDFLRIASPGIFSIVSQELRRWFSPGRDRILRAIYEEMHLVHAEIASKLRHSSSLVGEGMFEEGASILSEVKEELEAELLLLETLRKLYDVRNLEEIKKGGEKLLSISEKLKEPLSSLIRSLGKFHLALYYEGKFRGKKEELKFLGKALNGIESALEDCSNENLRRELSISQKFLSLVQKFWDAYVSRDWNRSKEMLKDVLEESKRIAGSIEKDHPRRMNFVKIHYYSKAVLSLGSWTQEGDKEALENWIKEIEIESPSMVTSDPGLRYFNSLILREYFLMKYEETGEDRFLRMYEEVSRRMTE